MEQASQLLVLNYHHVSDNVDTAFSVTPRTLMEQLESLLNRGFVPLSINGLVGLDNDSRSDRNFFLVTFDDGYDDFMTHALPVLEALGIPAALFIIGDYIGGWNDWDLLRRSKHRHLTLDELIDLRSHGVEFGGHSRTHPMLTSLNRKELESEILGPKTILESALNMPVRAFAYPGGHFNRRVMQLTARYYSLGFAAAPRGPVKQFRPFQIHRFDPFCCRDLDDFKTALLPMLISLSPAPSLFGNGGGRFDFLFGLFRKRRGELPE